MSFISEEEFESRIQNERNLINIFPERFSETKEAGQAVNEKDIESFVQNGVIVNSEHKRETGVQGKVLGDRNIPEVIRDVITIQSSFAPVIDVAKSWGVSPASVSNLKNGMPDRVNPNSHRNLRAQDVLSNNVAKIRKVVEKKILSTLEFITNEALESQDAKNLSVIAKNLSQIVHGVENKDIGSTNINVQTIFYAPEPARVEDYEVING